MVGSTSLASWTRSDWLRRKAGVRKMLLLRAKVFSERRFLQDSLCRPDHSPRPMASASYQLAVFLKDLYEVILIAAAQWSSKITSSAVTPITRHNLTERDQKQTSVTEGGGRKRLVIVTSSLIVRNPSTRIGWEPLRNTVSLSHPEIQAASEK